MSVTETMALTLLVTGGLSLYLILHAVVDLLRHGFPERPEYHGSGGVNPALPAPDIGHIPRHDGHERYVDRKRQVGHV
jgi:hypothetical protein